MKKIFLFLTASLFVVNALAQSTNSAWFYGLYKSANGDEIVISQENVVFLNQDRLEKDIATFCTYSLQKGNILTVENEIGCEYGILVLNPSARTASHSFEFMVEDRPDGSMVFKPVEGAEMVVYQKVDALGPTTMRKVNMIQEQRLAVLKENNVKIAKLIEDNPWLVGVWVSDDNSAACAVLSNGFVLYYESFIETIQSSPMHNDDGKIYIPCKSPSENGVIIDKSKKVIETYFAKVLHKIAPK